MLGSRVFYHKHAGNDDNSWAVFVDGQPKWTGMTRSEAAWRARRERQRLEPNRIDPRSVADD